MCIPPCTCHAVAVIIERRSFKVLLFVCNSSDSRSARHTFQVLSVLIKFVCVSAIPHFASKTASRRNASTKTGTGVRNEAHSSKLPVEAATKTILCNSPRSHGRMCPLLNFIDWTYLTKMQRHHHLMRDYI